MRCLKNDYGAAAQHQYQVLCCGSVCSLEAANSIPHQPQVICPQTVIELLNDVEGGRTK